MKAVVHDTLHATPDDGSTHWTTRLMAKRFGIGKDTVARIWANHNLKPWRIEIFKLSNDPDFEDKLVDVVGLYMNPPERAVVLSFDEKTQAQALDRTQPSLPLKPGRGTTLTHDYRRHGTTDVFAALNVATGEVLYDCKKGHSAEEVLRFFKLIDIHVPAHLDIHVVLDNLSAHNAPPVADWLAHPKRARWHLHFTPTSSSWLNLVERWFNELTERRLRRGVFTSVAPLSRPSSSGPSTGTTTRSPSSGTSPPKRSSPKSAADEPLSPESNPRRATSRPTAPALAMCVCRRRVFPAARKRRTVTRARRSSTGRTALVNGTG